MSITDELREFASHCAGGMGGDSLRHIADRIDDAALSERNAAYNEGYDSARESVIYDMRREHDEWVADRDTNWVKLPVDADGVPIRVGDVMDKGKVTCICDCGKGWEVIINSLYTYDAPSLRHHEPTVEDVLREFANRVCNSGHQWGLDADDTIAEYAAKLRLAGDTE